MIIFFTFFLFSDSSLCDCDDFKVLRTRRKRRERKRSIIDSSLIFHISPTSYFSHLISLFFSLLISWMFDVKNSLDIETIGHIPSHFPPVSYPTFHRFSDLIWVMKWKMKNELLISLSTISFISFHFVAMFNNFFIWFPLISLISQSSFIQEQFATSTWSRIVQLGDGKCDWFLLLWVLLVSLFIYLILSILPSHHLIATQPVVHYQDPLY